MSTTVNRVEFLQKLEMLQPGLSTGREVIEQSSCFVFRDGRAFTFNDEIACSVDLDLNWTGAVQAKPLMAILAKLPDDTLTVETDETSAELVLKGRSKESRVRAEMTVFMPLENVEQPKAWHVMDENLCDALATCSPCVARDSNDGFNLQCVHITPDCVEACDNFQFAHYPVATGVRGPILVKEAGLRNVASLGMTEMGETKTWLHFRNAAGLVISCRKYLDEYPTLTHLFNLDEATPTTLPKGLADAVERAEIFSAEDSENNQVLVELRPGKLRITGRSSNGSHKEMKDIEYQGAPLAFSIAPKMLAGICKAHNDCHITKKALVVDGGNFKYVSCLSIPSE